MAAVQMSKRYDGKIDSYARFLDSYLEGVSAKPGLILQPRLNGDVEQFECASIDRIAELPNDFFHMDIEPIPFNGGYHVNVLIYTDAAGTAKFNPIPGGNGRANVKYPSKISSKIYDLLINSFNIEDLTLMPIDPTKDQPHVKSEKIARIHQRLTENREVSYLYFHGNMDGHCAFVVHLPEDPYHSADLIRSLISEIQRF
jgi:hypothetical protein